MRIVEKKELPKLVSLLTRIRKHYLTGFQQSKLHPHYMFWNAAGNEQSKMYKTVYATPALLEEAEKLIAETSL